MPPEIEPATQREKGQHPSRCCPNHREHVARHSLHPYRVSDSENIGEVRRGMELYKSGTIALLSIETWAADPMPRQTQMPLARRPRTRAARVFLEV